MYAGVDRWVASCSGVNFSHNSQARMEICEAARWQRAASSCELQKCFPLIAVHLHENVDESNKAGAGGGKNFLSKTIKAKRDVASPFFAVS